MLVWLTGRYAPDIQADRPFPLTFLKKPDFSINLNSILFEFDKKKIKAILLKQ